MAMLNSELRTGGLLPYFAGRLGRAGLALALVVALSCNVTSQDKGTPAKSESKADDKDQTPAVAKGEIVAELDPAIWRVYQAKNNDYWFGSRQRGAYRYDGKCFARRTIACTGAANPVDCEWSVTWRRPGGAGR